MATTKSTTSKRKTKTQGKTAKTQAKASARIPYQNQRGNGNTNYAGWYPARMSKRWAQNDPSATGQPVLTGHVFRQLVARSQMIDAQFPIGNQILSRGVEHITQLGFSPAIKCDDAEWVYEVEEKLAAWLETADLAGNSWLQHQQLVCRSWLRDGDVCIIFSKDGQQEEFGWAGLHVVESNRVVTPSSIPDGKTIIDGIELSDTGAVVAVHVCMNEGGETKRIKAEYCAFLCRKNRACAVRGEGVFTQCFEIMDSFTSYVESVTRAADAQSRVTMVVTTDKDKKSPFGNLEQDQHGNRFMQSESGQVYVAPPGGNLEMLKADSVSIDHGKFLREIMRILHNALGMPLDVTDPSDSNYSSSRIALQQAQMAFRLLQQLMIDGYLKPMVKWWISKGIADGWIRNPGKSWSVDFVKPAFRYQDRLSETQADILEINAGLKSYRQAVNERGLPYEGMLKAQVDEAADRKLYELPDMPRSTFIQQSAPTTNISELAAQVAEWQAANPSPSLRGLARKAA
jgi:capsid protein